MPPVLVMVPPRPIVGLERRDYVIFWVLMDALGAAAAKS